MKTEFDTFNEALFALIDYSHIEFLESLTIDKVFTTPIWNITEIWFIYYSGKERAIIQRDISGQHPIYRLTIKG